MSREIKFRVMDIDGNWHYFTLGDFVCLTPIPAQLRPETWTQYTGLKDADGTEIYESDIIKMWYAPMATCNGIIEFVDGCFVFTTKQAKPNVCSLFACANDYGNSLTVIGNIHQHPELLK